jgi:hypothetical protein
MAPVIDVTRDALVARRDEIYAALGMSPEEFKDAMRTRTLSGEEWEAKEELESIAFLLADAES